MVLLENRSVIRRAGRFAVHIGGAPLESGHHFESQTIQRIQNVFGRTLRHTHVLLIIDLVADSCRRTTTRRREAAMAFAKGWRRRWAARLQETIHHLARPSMP